MFDNYRYAMFSAPAGETGPPPLSPPYEGGDRGGGEESTDGLAEEGFRAGRNIRQPWPTGAQAVDTSAYPGKLVVIEGTDGAGRSTQLALLREWLEAQGFGVAHTALTRSRLVGEGLRKAKQGHTLGRTTMDLFYATDFADRLENQVLPALRGGFVVLTDRYIYSAMARSIVRGGEPEWLHDVYRFAPAPHAVFYLKVDLPNLTPRVLSRGVFDYWESGLDFQEETDLYQSFVRYQKRLLDVFDKLAVEYGFRAIDANRGVQPVFLDLKNQIQQVVSRMGKASPK